MKDSKDKEAHRKLRWLKRLILFARFMFAANGLFLFMTGITIFTHPLDSLSMLGWKTTDITMFRILGSFCVSFSAFNIISAVRTYHPSSHNTCVWTNAILYCLATITFVVAAITNEKANDSQTTVIFITFIMFAVWCILSGTISAIFNQDIVRIIKSQKKNISNSSSGSDSA